MCKISFENMARMNNVSLKQCADCGISTYWTIGGYCKDCHNSLFAVCKHCGVIYRKNTDEGREYGSCRLCTLTRAKRVKTSFTPVGDILSLQGIREIENKLNIWCWPDEWDWRIMTKRGSLAKRIAKIYKEQKNVKIDNALAGVIGSIIGQYTTSPKNYIFDFTDRFNWDSGDYGDDGSCYWGCRNDARKAMMDNGNCRAIRFFNGNSGYARAWIYTTGEDNHIVFNGYGLQTDAIAGILAGYLGLSYKKISLSNYDTTDGMIYINGGRGYIVGKDTDIKTISSYNMEIECEDENRYTCCNCEYGLSEDEGYPVHGDIYCEDCLNDLFSCCERCGEYVDNDSIVEVHRTNFTGRAYSEYQCENCADRHFNKCADCGEWHEATNTVYKDGDNEEVCNSCFESYSFCDDCEEWCNSSNTVNKDGNEIYVCDDCFDDYEICRVCGRCFDHVNHGDKIDYCDDCEESLMIEKQTYLLDVA